MALTLLSLTVIQPTAAVPTGAVQVSVDGPTATYTIDIPGLTSGPAPMTLQAIGYLFYQAGIAPGDYAGTADNGTDALAVAFTIRGLPTADTTPPAVSAAHLPLLAVLRAAPYGTPLAPAVLLLVVEVQRAGAWVEAGKLREGCDPVLGTALFDLSEFVKTQFADTPPDETGGIDAALSIRYRARYGLAPDFIGVAGTEAGSFEGLALNAAEVVNPSAAPLPFALGPPAPYASVPAGYARFESLLTSSAGVTNVATVAVASSDWPCPVRQFVWLHPSGAWAWGFFSGRHEHGDETGDGALVRRAGGVEKYVSRGDVRNRLSVYSDKVDFATYQVLRTVRTSVQVYERLPSGLYVPVVVEAGSYPGYKETDKTFEVNFTVRYPIQVRQTQ
jgi:hypothetical protein